MTDSWKIYNDGMFERGVNTLLFHNVGIYGYYGKFVMEAIKLAVTKEQRNINDIRLTDFSNQTGGRVAKEINSQLNNNNPDINPSIVKDIILSNLENPFEKLRCDLYKAGIIKKTIDTGSIAIFEKVFNETYEKIMSRISNDRKSKPHAFEDSFDILDENELNEYKKACKLIYDRCPDECILIYILIFPIDMSKTYKIYLMTIKHFTRPKPLNENEWTDNYGLNNYGLASSLTELKNDINKDSYCIYTMESYPFEMNKSIKFDIDDCIVNLIHPVKIIDALLYSRYGNLYVSKDTSLNISKDNLKDNLNDNLKDNIENNSINNQQSIENNIQANSKNDVERNIENNQQNNQQSNNLSIHGGSDSITNELLDMFTIGNESKKWILLDYIASKYPNYYAGTHGCNCFQINKSIKYDTLVKFLLRYPTCQIGCILNTARYGEAGEHWTALTFRNLLYDYSNDKYERIALKNPYFKVYFCCSFGSNINILHQDIVSDIKKAYNNLSVEVITSGTKIQIDNHNCGIFALLFILMLYMYPGRIEKVREITSDAKNIKLKSIQAFRDAILGSNSISLYTDAIE